MCLTLYPAGPIIAVAVAVADLLERDELDLDVVLLLEGEEEVVCDRLSSGGDLSLMKTHRTALAYKLR
jgi:hypothetical protein